MIRRALTAFLCIAVVVGLWQALVTLAELPRFLLPAPGDVGLALWKYRTILTENAATSALNLLQGLALGLLLGVETALLLALSPRLRAVLRPTLTAAQAIPVFALAPVITLWLGFGAASKIAIVALMTYFPIASALFDGLMRLPTPLEDLARQSGASRWRRLIHLQLPHARPAFFSGLRLAVTFAPLAVILGEWVGASKGLGHLMLLANGRGQTDLMFAALLVLAAFSLSLWALVDALGRRADR